MADTRVPHIGAGLWASDKVLCSYLMQSKLLRKSQGTVVISEWKTLVTALVESRWEVRWWESCSAGTLLGESLVKSLGESMGESLQGLAPNVESLGDNAHGESLGELLGK
jgi:hypothetical protein